MMQLELNRGMGRVDGVVAGGRGDGDRRGRGGLDGAGAAASGAGAAARSEGEDGEACAGEKRFHVANDHSMTERPRRMELRRLRCAVDMEQFVAIATKTVATATKLRAQMGLQPR